MQILQAHYTIIASYLLVTGARPDKSVRADWDPREFGRTTVVQTVHENRLLESHDTRTRTVDEKSRRAKIIISTPTFDYEFMTN